MTTIRRVLLLIAATAACAALSSCASSPQLSGEQLDEVMSLRKVQLVELASTLGLDPEREIPELIQWRADSDADYESWEACTKEQYSVAYHNGAEIGEEASREAFWVCSAKYSRDPRTQLALTRAQFETMYHHATEVLKPCIEQRGFDVGPAPSLNEFITGHRMGDMWSPYDFVNKSSMSDDLWEKLTRECPPETPATELYGPPLPQPQPSSYG